MTDITSISVSAADEVAAREVLKLRSCTLKRVTDGLAGSDAGSQWRSSTITPQ
jgi:hypothetical protein